MRVFSPFKVFSLLNVRKSESGLAEKGNLLSMPFEQLYQVNECMKSQVPETRWPLLFLGESGNDNMLVVTAPSDKVYKF